MTTVAWGAKVSDEFIQKTWKICADLQVADPNWLMACMAFESAETFHANVKNMAGSGAVGLIQFMPQTATALGTTIENLSTQTAEDQLRYVADYFGWLRGRLNSLEDVYMAILWPGAIGKSNDSVLWDRNDPKHPYFYMQNRGLDWNNDGQITKGEACAFVRAKLEKGLKEPYVRVVDYL